MIVTEESLPRYQGIPEEGRILFWDVSDVPAGAFKVGNIIQSRMGNRFEIARVGVYRHPVYVQYQALSVFLKEENAQG